ncbi:MAG: hypothetical protein Q8O24_06505 [Gallionellaceae bacterium]|nr:hypothetical protein [Gallionellaceae bacterium]
MGAMVGQTCYLDPLLARDAFFQAIAPIILPTGNTVFYQKNAVSLVWQRIEVKPNMVILSSTNASTPLLPVCDPMLGFNDGISLAVIIVTLVFLASSFGILARAR